MSLSISHNQLSPLQNRFTYGPNLGHGWRWQNVSQVSETTYQNAFEPEVVKVTFQSQKEQSRTALLFGGAQFYPEVASGVPRNELLREVSESGISRPPQTTDDRSQDLEILGVGGDSDIQLLPNGQDDHSALQPTLSTQNIPQVVLQRTRSREDPTTQAASIPETAIVIDQEARDLTRLVDEDPWTALRAPNSQRSQELPPAPVIIPRVSPTDNLSPASASSIPSLWRDRDELTRTTPQPISHKPRRSRSSSDVHKKMTVVDLGPHFVNLLPRKWKSKFVRVNDQLWFLGDSKYIHTPNTTTWAGRIPIQVDPLDGETLSCLELVNGAAWSFTPSDAWRSSRKSPEAQPPVLVAGLPVVVPLPGIYFPESVEQPRDRPVRSGSPLSPAMLKNLFEHVPEAIGCCSFVDNSLQLIAPGVMCGREVEDILNRMPRDWHGWKLSISDCKIQPTASGSPRVSTSTNRPHSLSIPGSSRPSQQNLRSSATSHSSPTLPMLNSEGRIYIGNDSGNVCRLGVKLGKRSSAGDFDEMFLTCPTHAVFEYAKKIGKHGISGHYDLQGIEVKDADTGAVIGHIRNCFDALDGASMPRETDFPSGYTYDICIVEPINHDVTTNFESIVTKWYPSPYGDYPPEMKVMIHNDDNTSEWHPRLLEGNVVTRAVNKRVQVVAAVVGSFNLNRWTRKPKPSEPGLIVETPTGDEFLSKDLLDHSILYRCLGVPRSKKHLSGSPVVTLDAAYNPESLLGFQSFEFLRGEEFIQEEMPLTDMLVRTLADGHASLWGAMRPPATLTDEPDEWGELVNHQMLNSGPSHTSTTPLAPPRPTSAPAPAPVALSQPAPQAATPTPKKGRLTRFFRHLSCWHA